MATVGDGPARLRDLRRDLFGAGAGGYWAAAVVAFLFASTGPVAIILTVVSQGGLGRAELAAWLFGSFFLNGLITIGFCLRYRQPLVFFWTIPGAVLVGQALDHMSFAEVIGAYYAVGLLMVGLGLSGLVGRAMAALPLPIVMGMVAGVFLPFGLGLIGAFAEAAWIALPMAAAFALLSALPRLGRAVPPLIGALAVGVAAAVLSGTGAPDAAAPLAGPAFELPSLFRPAFSWAAMVELVVPLTVTVLAAQNAQGIAVLRTAGHKPPVDAVTVACGAGSLASALFGAVSTCLTGPVNAILSASGARERQYAGGVLVGLMALAFGAFSPVFTRLLLAAPAALAATLAGLAMLRVLQAAFRTAYQGRFTLGALVAFLVTAADLPLWQIGAPFWGLVAGLGVSALLERDDFRGES